MLASTVTHRGVMAACSAPLEMSTSPRGVFPVGTSQIIPLTTGMGLSLPATTGTPVTAVLAKETAGVGAMLDPLGLNPSREGIILEATQTHTKATQRGVSTLMLAESRAAGGRGFIPTPTHS